MPYTLLATQVPVPPVFSGTYDPTTGPLTSKSFSAGATTAVRPNLSENAGRQDLVGRYGGGGYAVATGLAISAGSGLTLNIAAGHALIDGIVPVSATTATMTDAGRNHVWVSRAGAITTVFNSLTPPVGAFAYLGSALTAAGAISSVDQSGVLYIRGGVLVRQTSDSSLPTDVPPSSLVFVNIGSSKTWLWTGSAYVDITGNGLPLGRLAKAVSASFTFTALELSTVSEVEMTAGGIGATFTATFPAVGLTAGQMWAVDNETGYAAIVKLSGGTERFLGTGQYAIYLYTGSDLIELCRNSPRYGTMTITSPTQTFSSWEEVESDYQKLVPSGGNATAAWAGSLNQRGRRQVITNDHASLVLTVRTSGAGTDTGAVFLPGETHAFVVSGSGEMILDHTRPYTRRVGVSFASDANKTVAAPDFLATHLDVTSGVSLTATRDLILPVVDSKGWSVKNSTTGGQSIRVIGASGTGVTIRPGKSARVRQNGTDFILDEERAIVTSSSEEVAATTTSTVTIANSAVEATLLGTAIGSLTLPAAVLQPGRTIRFRAWGYHSTDAAAAGTLRLKLKLGSTVILDTGAQTATNALANRHWKFEGEITCRTTGATGTVFGQGLFTFCTAATGNLQAWEAINTATSTVDTTGTLAVDLTATWGTADSDNSISCSQAIVELLN